MQQLEIWSYQSGAVAPVMVHKTVIVLGTAIAPRQTNWRHPWSQDSHGPSFQPAMIDKWPLDSYFGLGLRLSSPEAEDNSGTQIEIVLSAVDSIWEQGQQVIGFNQAQSDTPIQVDIRGRFSPFAQVLVGEVHASGALYAAPG
jgi:hypothetical protein